MIDRTQLCELVVEVLTDLQMATPAAVNLILGTIAQESTRGTKIKQVGGGPALGICQVEPGTEKDVWRYLNRPDKADIKARFVAATGVPFASDRQRKANMAYGIALARIKYWMDREPLPAADDVSGMARAWKRVYNTVAGTGTVEEFIKNYKELVL